MKSNLTLAFTIAFLVLSGLFGTAEAQSGSVDLSNKRVTIKVENVALGKVFQDLLYKEGIPIGLELSNLDSDHNDYWFETNLPYNMILSQRSRAVSNGSFTYSVDTVREFKAKGHFISLNLENATINDLFDSIVDQMSNYKWEIVDGVVNISPKSDRDPIFVKLLDLKLEKFDLRAKAPKWAIQSVLYGLPEFEKFISDNDLATENLRTNFENLDAQVPQATVMSNVKVIELLNSMAKNKRGGWFLRFKKEKTVDGRQIIDLDI